jgi:small subunit ribosomal protein S21
MNFPLCNMYFYVVQSRVFRMESGFSGVHMLKVKMRSGESVQQMIRRFKKLCEKEGLIRDMKRTAYYEKPSERERRRMRKAQRIVRH